MFNGKVHFGSLIFYNGEGQGARKQSLQIGGCRQRAPAPSKLAREPTTLPSRMWGDQNFNPPLNMNKALSWTLKLKYVFLRVIFCWQTYRVVFSGNETAKQNHLLLYLSRYLPVRWMSFRRLAPGKKNREFRWSYMLHLQNEHGPWRWCNWNRKLIASDHDISLKTLLITKKKLFGILIQVVVSNIFIFTLTWGRFPFWLILFKWVETTNQ